jgi:4-carboxymuconolactone decarboxylase
MARVKLIQDREDVAPENYALFDELAALRGRISGPSTVVLHSPGLARPWNEISEYLHRESIVEAANAELAVCATARAYDCAYIWNAHIPSARKAAVREETLAAVQEDGSLNGLPAGETLVVNYVRQLLEANRVSDDIFAPLLGAHGDRWMVELTCWIGRYAALAGILNAFEVTPAPGAEPLPVSGKRSSSRGIARAFTGHPRIVPIGERAKVAEAGRSVFDLVAEGRGSVRGPFAVLMHSPPLCKRVFDVSNYLRFESELTPAERELATLVTAREKDCPYVWAAHASAARQAGVSNEIVETVRSRGALDVLSAEDRDITVYTRQLLQVHRVDQSVFDSLRNARGERWLVELTALIGHYGMVSAILNSAEIAPPAGSEALD